MKGPSMKFLICFFGVPLSLAIDAPQVVFILEQAFLRVGLWWSYLMTRI